MNCHQNKYSVIMVSLYRCGSVNIQYLAALMPLHASAASHYL